MRTPITDAPATIVDGRDLGRLVEEYAADLARRFPHSLVWFGMATRHWWAYTRDTNGAERLLEANGPYNLAALLDSTPRMSPVAVSARPFLPAPPDRPRGSKRRSHGGRHARH